LALRTHAWKRPAVLGLMVLGVTASASPARQITTLIYVTGGPDAAAAFRAHARKISIIAPQTFSIDAQGFVAGAVPPPLMEIAAQYRVGVMPLIVNRDFDQRLMQTVLDSPQARARAIRYLIYYALRDGLLGFQFDFENIHYTYRGRFTAFFREAACEFHKHGLQLSVAVVGRKGDARGGGLPDGYEDWSGVYDYAGLAQYADFISVMAYEEHGLNDDPGPVAGLPWVRGIALYSAKTIGAPLVSLGLPLYGMRWEAAAPSSARRADDAPHSTANGAWYARWIAYSETAAALMTMPAAWDKKEQSPHLSFDNQGRHVVLWFENARSLQAKIQLARALGFAGISAWVLGQEDPAFWNLLDASKVRHLGKPPATGALEPRSKNAVRAMLADSHSGK
jgi:spore germination protein YaaH